MTSIKDLKEELWRLADPEKAKVLQRFFRTGPGQYGEGDIFLGVVVPKTRKLARKYHDLGLGDAVDLLRSPIHEERLLALLILVSKFQKVDPETRERIFSLYLGNTRNINNWDLVDLSAEHIVGAFLMSRNKKILSTLARSESLWEKRIAILATFHYIKKGMPEPTLAVAKILINDRHDLIHKAVGWMLREVGKRCGEAVEEAFLRLHYKRMPRTMLRYAIERFPERKRRAYLDGTA